MSIVRIVGLIAVACGFAACTFILCAFLNLRIECTAYSAEKDTQMELIDNIARQVPNPSFQQEGSLALSLHNVWGNTMQAEFFPGDRNARNLDEMTELTTELQQIEANTTAENAAGQLKKAYKLLLDSATNKEFVARYRASDVKLLDSVGVPDE